ncbi:Hypothetical protein PHPALM_8698 [Phytophthora palmivora]|uniref:Uncharacterized protein n=1 Tax=Phytophthora palmivora TaxID=4796 RepID=A0A2P4Y961_9STRA|nr:Hypothetical protein PHPALM_8698 [Phytophthora palmivora]
MRRKQHGVAATNVELTGPQPGVPFSTDSANMGRHRVISPRKSITVHHPTQIDTTNGQTEYSPQLNNINGAGLQLSIDTELVHQENSGQSPSPLSKSPSSTVSARRRPHPPGSAPNGQTIKRMDTCKLPTQYTEPIASRVSTPNVQPNQYHGKQRAKETVLTETASDSSTADSSLPGDQQGRDHNLNTDGWVKSDDVSSAEIAASCACGSSSSMVRWKQASVVPLR